VTGYRAGAPPGKSAAPVVSEGGEVERLPGGSDIRMVQPPAMPMSVVIGERRVCRYCGQPPTLPSREERRWLKRKLGVAVTEAIRHHFWCPMSGDGGSPGGDRRG
jgi:hypothetical protein